MEWLNTYHLICKHENSLQGEFSLAIVEQILQTWTKQVNNHNIVVSLNSKPMHIWDSNFKLSINQKAKKQEILRVKLDFLLNQIFWDWTYLLPKEFDIA